MAYLNEQKRQVREVLAERLHAECGEDYPTAPNLIFSVPASAFEQKPEPLSLLSIPGLPPGVTVRVDGLVRAHR
ncbi:MAG: hypothetical protein SF002_01965 [Alphaproteobacteria bacterium]|nr:hypothetical protein [Alphaproteobacteria bacterium]